MIIATKLIKTLNKQFKSIQISLKLIRVLLSGMMFIALVFLHMI